MFTLIAGSLAIALIPPLASDSSDDRSSPIPVASLPAAAPQSLPLGHGMLTFDGVDDVCLIRRTPDMVLTDAMTLEAWVRPDTVHTGGIAGLWGGGGLADAYILHLIDNQPVARIVRDGEPGWTFVTATAPIPAGAWTHVAMTYDGADLVLLVNGVVVGSAPAPGTLGNGFNADFRLGIDDIIFGNVSYFDGAMDEVRLWHTARTPAQILARRDHAFILPGDAADLAAMWRLDEDFGVQTVADATLGPSFGVLGLDGCPSPADPERSPSSAPLVSAADCNGTGNPDFDDIQAGTSDDGDGNGLPDECRPYCPADVDHDLVVGFSDLLTLLAEWGPSCGFSDLDGNGETDFNDLLNVLEAWGPCR